MKRSPEWWAVYAAAWVNRMQSSQTRVRVLEDGTYETFTLTHADVARDCARVADEAIAAAQSLP